MLIEIKEVTKVNISIEMTLLQAKAIISLIDDSDKSKLFKCEELKKFYYELGKVLYP